MEGEPALPNSNKMKEPVTRCWIDKDFGHSDFCLKCKYRVECAERSGKEFKVAKNLHKHSSLKEW